MFDNLEMLVQFKIQSPLSRHKNFQEKLPTKSHLSNVLMDCRMVRPSKPPTPQLSSKINV